MEVVSVLVQVPHGVTMRTKDGRSVTFPPSGVDARLVYKKQTADEIITEHGVVGIQHRSISGVTNLQRKKPGQIIIVSLQVALYVAMFMPDRDDVYSVAGGIHRGGKFLHVGALQQAVSLREETP